MNNDHQATLPLDLDDRPIDIPDPSVERPDRPRPPEHAARPEEIGLMSLRDLGPSIGRLRARHQLNILGMEALAAAIHLEAHVHLSTNSPKLEAALEAEELTVTVS